MKVFFVIPFSWYIYGGISFTVNYSHVRSIAPNIPVSKAFTSARPTLAGSGTGLITHYCAASQRTAHPIITYAVSFITFYLSTPMSLG